MRSDRLLSLYERVSEAPDAITRLRRFILDLAVRGKLVEQDPEDETASELLERIRAESARLFEAGEIKKSKSSAPIAAEVAPYPLPSSWRWVHLSDVLTKLTDGTHHSPPNGPEGEFLYVTAKNIKDDGVKLDDVSYVSRAVHEEIYARCNPEPGDILYIKDGATTGVVTINNVDQPFSMLSSVALLKPSALVCSKLLVWFLRSPFFYGQMRSFMKGAAITRVTLKRMGPALLPLPPLGEQKRIVAKVEELMALLDRLEEVRSTRETARARLTTASLARLTASDSEEPDARFALAQLSRLSERPDQIQQLRRAILNLAVRGSLTPAAGTRPPLVRVGSVAFLQNGYAFKSEWFSKTGIRLLRNANVSLGSLAWLEEVRLPENRRSEFARFELEEGDVVLSLDRPFIAGGTKVARVTSSDLPALLLQRVGRFVITGELDPGYLFLWINSPHFEGQVDPGRSSGVPHISSKQVEAAEIFLPSLTEQGRIIAKVNELTALLDRLEASAIAADSARARLLDALLNESLNPTPMAEAA